MKRISVLVLAISTVLSVTANATICHRCNQYRVRWSPYTHSLVSGNVKYSPYAFKRGSSGMVYKGLRYSPYARGLVHKNVRYSPYAFGFKKSGLVADPWISSYNCHCARPRRSACAVIYRNSSRSSYPPVKRRPRNYNRRINNCRAASTVRKAVKNNPGRQRNRHIEEKQLNGRDVIAAYLNLFRIDYNTSRILSIEGNLISIDFILTDRNIIIKYWNPEAILALKRRNNSRIAYYENYLESYGNYCSEYLENGGEIHQIITADNKEILAKLFDCNLLKVKKDTESTTVVAKAGEESDLQEATN